jgi:hypothetical protein
MDVKKAADELLKIADEIEKDAAEATKFQCPSCSHTATLASINAKRQEAAKTAGDNVTVADITVNDKVKCPACDGVMAYRETEASKQYYYDPDKAAAEEKDLPPHDEADEPGGPGHKEPDEDNKPKASVDYDSI